MPIEIKELVIRASVGDDRAAGDGARGSAERRPAHGAPTGALPQAEIDRIVDACVERVLKAIKKSQER